MTRLDTLDRAYRWVFNTKNFANTNTKVSVAARFAAYYIGNPQPTFSIAYKKFTESIK